MEVCEKRLNALWQSHTVACPHSEWPAAMETIMLRKKHINTPSDNTVSCSYTPFLVWETNEAVYPIEKLIKKSLKDSISIDGYLEEITPS